MTGLQDDSYGGVLHSTYVETDDERCTLITPRGRIDVGTFHLPSVAQLRAVCPPLGSEPAALRRIKADVQDLMADPNNHGATFQVASQFNLLEMPGPKVRPSDGIRAYADDHTQGPACAMATAGATIFRNYYLQRDEAQVDTTEDLRCDLAERLGCSEASLWSCMNGYLIPAHDGLTRANSALHRLDPAEAAAPLRIGVHTGAEVTLPDVIGQRVNLALASAVPMAYFPMPVADWQPLATTILTGAYEATLLQAQRTRAAGGSSKVFLTTLGGGAFGNPSEWIYRAMFRAVQTAGAGLRIFHVVRG